MGSINFTNQTFQVKNITIIFLLLSNWLTFSSCLNTKQTTYFANARDTSFKTINEDKEPLIQKNDILSVNISSLSTEASAIFNTPNYTTTSTSTSNGASVSGGYLVNSEGTIQIPIVGIIQVAGFTKKQVSDTITKKILDEKLLIDPIVTIRYLNYEVTVIGEVAKPTVINVPNEKISLLKALGIAGDITVFGKKDNLLLIREIQGKRNIKRININSQEFLSSNYYYLQPNDIIYVEPNKQKVISANRNQQLLPTILSALSIVAVLIAQKIN